MRELSLNILDVVQNSISAGASLITIEVLENTKIKDLTIKILDNGKGMTNEQLKSVQDPFYTTRTTRKVGMGVPLFKMAAEMSAGSFDIKSEVNVGTQVTACFKTDNLDFVPLGDMCSTIITLVSMNTKINFVYKHCVDEKEFVFDTRKIKEILGDVPLDENDVVVWLREYVQENINNLYGGVFNNENS